MTDSPLTHNVFLSRRTLRFVALILFFGIQLYFPLTYYFGDHPWDERFSWRMFSTVRNLKCAPKVWVSAPQGSQLCPDQSGERCVQKRLSGDIHMVWINLMKRGRMSVMSSYVAHQCARQPERSLYISLTCQSPTPPHQMISLISPSKNQCAPMNAQGGARDHGSK
jgi:hypothetical protein